MAKFTLHCTNCGLTMQSFREWFDNNQSCPGCNLSDHAEVDYADYSLLKEIRSNPRNDVGLWRYFDLLPVLDKRHVVTAGEGMVAIDNWKFLEVMAKEYFGIDCRVYAHRNDNNYATGTFKDYAASVAASVLRENNIQNLVIASTGNIGVAYSRYLSEAGVDLYAFVPSSSSSIQAAEIACFGQQVFIVDGDYGATKQLAKQFARKHGFQLAAGTFDPIRIQAKKVMAYEWLRKMDEMPTVYVQALSGGTGPLGVAVGCRDMVEMQCLDRYPRFILAQSDACAPMAEAWTTAAQSNFAGNWYESYPIYENPETKIATLATGNPYAYPRLAQIVHETDGAIIACQESLALDIAFYIAFMASVRIGPAAAMAVAGFLQSLAAREIRNGDVVLVNIGEGIRRSPEFMLEILEKHGRMSCIRDVRKAKATRRLDQRQIIENLLLERLSTGAELCPIC